jgi:hypothetical protein
MKLRKQRTEGRARVFGATAATAALLAIAALCATASAMTLPDGRAYELVSPSSTQGSATGGLTSVAVGQDGDTVIDQSTGAFAGTQADYLGGNWYAYQRTASGWSAGALDPSPNAYDNSADDSLITSSDFTSEAMLAQTPAETADSTGPDLVVRNAGGSWHTVVSSASGAPGFASIGSSAALSTLAFNAGGYQLLPDAAAAGTQTLYAVTGATGASPTLETVGVDGSGAAYACGAYLGDASAVGGGVLHAVSDSGQTIFFDAVPGSGSNCPPVFEVEARTGVGTGSEQTVDVSEPAVNDECTTAGCTGATPEDATYQGASTDGSKVFFTTTQPLVDGAVGDSTTNLYEYDFDNAAGENLVQVSGGDTSGAGAGVQGVVAISDDGSHVYFVATGVLSDQANAEGVSATAGADNLYVFERDSAYPDGHITFIGELCSGADASGSATDTDCPSGSSDASLWTSGTDAGAAQVTDGDGQYLVFSTYAQLITSGPTADSNDTQDVYEYNAQTGGLVRVSIGQDGYDDNGNAISDNASIPSGITGSATYEGAQAGVWANRPGRAVSDNGQYVFFTTAEPLAAQDVSGNTNVYEWEQPGAGSCPSIEVEGCVSLITDGQDTSDTLHGQVYLVGTTPSANDVFFTTTDELVPQDIDGQVQHLYDARVGGGFPVPATTVSCSGEDCQAPASAAPTLAVAATVSFSGPGDITTHSTAKVTIANKRVEGSRFAVSAKVPGKGRITASGADVRTARKSAARAGTYWLTLSLTANAKRTLRRRHRLEVTVRIRYVPSAGATSSATAAVTLKQHATTNRGGRS